MEIDEYYQSIFEGEEIDNLLSLVSPHVNNKTIHITSSERQTWNDAAQSIDYKQDTLVSGTNIKTINGESILGSGNITTKGGSTKWTDGGSNYASLVDDSGTSKNVSLYGHTHSGYLTSVAYNDLTTKPTQSQLTTIIGSYYALNSHTHAASDITSGTLATTRLPLSNLYWANVNISASPDEKTTPKFEKIIIGNICLSCDTDNNALVIDDGNGNKVNVFVRGGITSQKV